MSGYDKEIKKVVDVNSGQNSNCWSKLNPKPHSLIYYN